MTTKNLPVGIEDFEKLRRENFYYIDKTRLIVDLAEDWAEVNLFTRPRRFGKTLTMSMLQYFFEIGSDKTLFDGLEVAGNRELCEKHMGKYPVIFVSLKGVDGLTFAEAEGRLESIMREETLRHSYLRTSSKVSKENRELFEKMAAGKMKDIAESLRLLSWMLFQHYGKKTVLLIDEYDVPLDKAFAHGYYREMVSLMRGFLGQALKTNRYLQFAVLTGCLRISKESIFTGLNNFKVLSIVDVRFDEHFGFTDEEVKKLLADYGVSERFSDLKEWYDGYHFGNRDVYCPWDAINYVDLLRADPKARPRAFWINTSSNDLVKRFVARANRTTRDEIEHLVAGEAITKKVRLDLTYEEIDESIDNLWSVLFTTGYLTKTEEVEANTYRLVIPNREVREVFVWQIQEWFRETLQKDDTPVNTLCRALQEGDACEVQKRLTAILGKSISILDARAREGQKENFYHGLLLGLLQHEPEWGVHSNTEAGEGFSDIIVELEEPDDGIVIEVKYAATFSGLSGACDAAMRQIKDRDYAAYLREEGRENILAYGIAFHKKRCQVVVERM